LKANLEAVLEDNEELQKQLAQKLSEIERLMKENGVIANTINNLMKVTGDTNTVLQNLLILLLDFKNHHCFYNSGQYPVSDFCA
jgi:hypothetical protein